MTANAAMPEQFSPIRLLVTLLVLIFGIEGAMMFTLESLQRDEHARRAEKKRRA